MRFLQFDVTGSKQVADGVFVPTCSATMQCWARFLSMVYISLNPVC